MTRESIYDLIDRERLRQDTLKAEGKFKYTPADKVSSLVKLAMLSEEIGELAGAVIEEHHLAIDRTSDIKTELLHTATVAIAWMEAL